MNEKEKPQKKRINDIEREEIPNMVDNVTLGDDCLLYTSPSPRDRTRSRMPSSA